MEVAWFAVILPDVPEYPTAVAPKISRCRLPRQAASLRRPLRWPDGCSCCGALVLALSPQSPMVRKRHSVEGRASARLSLKVSPGSDRLPYFDASTAPG